MRRCQLTLADVAAAGITGCIAVIIVLGIAETALRRAARRTT